MYKVKFLDPEGFLSNVESTFGLSDSEESVVVGGSESLVVGGLESLVVGGSESLVVGGLEPVVVGGLEPVVDFFLSVDGLGFLGSSKDLSF